MATKISEGAIRQTLQRRRGIPDAEPEKPAQQLTIEEIRSQLLSDPEFVPQLATAIISGIKEIAKGDPGEKGVDGKTPQRGVDYFTEDDIRSIAPSVLKHITLPRNGRDGLNGRNGRDADEEAITRAVLERLPKPKAGKDFPSYDQVRALVASAAESTTLKFVPTDDKISEIATRVFSALEFTDHAEKIARALEGLTGEKRLSYAALRDAPGVKLYDGAKKGATRAGRLHRGGGGSPIYGYDLSSQCDGSNKTFSVPTHSRAIMLIGTDTPIVYKPTTDYSVTGTTLELTSAVPAPLSGATLIFEYAE